MQKTPRIIVFGTQSAFTLAVLEQLHNQDIAIGGLVLPGIKPVRSEPSPLPLAQHRHMTNPQGFAQHYNVPLLYTQYPQDQRLQAQLSALDPDLIIIACFPYRIPVILSQAFKRPWLNLHPSLLPKYRGPNPLFWQLRDGARQVGMSIHEVSERIDAGNIFAQSRIELDDGMRSLAINRRLGTQAAQLLMRSCIKQTTIELPPGIKQQEEQATYQHAPGAHDFSIPLSWSAQRAFNFMRACEDWQQPFHVEIDKRRFELQVATSYDAEQEISEPYYIEGSTIHLQFEQGILQAELWQD